MDLGDGWEKKALIVVAVVVVLLLIYVFNPITPQPDAEFNNTSLSTPSIINMPYDQSTGNTTNPANGTSNVTVQLTAEQAKNIAIQARPGYTAGDPVQETIVIDGITIAVWKVPLSKLGSTSKTLYIDLTSGRIVKET
ncbi:PepSY domain-containing protein [Methanobacterium sp. CWC-01]|uniref:peptidase n=1 Tax=Methanobacterium aridiramus TaxID=2584467 RepID=UPI0025768192|nr:peptidase [Methanobacterium sp. CWC-01]WJI08748.1 PepSY domain-containing protein [Methanobacterium sp. CWC-01]